MTLARRIGRAFAAASLLVATLGAHPALPSPDPKLPHAPPSLAPADVLARYARALEKIERPPAIAFDYSVEQLGLVNIVQTHRVYRRGRSERDETLIVDGYTLKRPSVRILANRTSRYDIAAVAPQPAAYRFTFGGKIVRENGYGYVYKTESLAPRAFSVTEIELDGRRFLPTVVHFKVGGTGARGSGVLSFVPTGRYWMVRDATVSAHLTNGAIAHEHIAWSDYSFPSDLPASTFQMPNAHTLEIPAPQATTTPEPPLAP